MNRKIKFRVWNAKTKSWVHGPDKRADLDGVNLFGETILLGAFMPVSITELNDCIPLQFTGLKDKKGKEIFEGDILALPDEETEAVLDYGQGPTFPFSHLSKVVFDEKDSAFGIVSIESGNYIKKGFNSFSLLLAEMDDDFISKETEILGNIYENPELLD